MRILAFLALVNLSVFNIPNTFAQNSTVSPAQLKLGELESGRFEFTSSELYSTCNALIDSFDQAGDSCALSATYSQLAMYYYKKGDFAALTEISIAAENLYSNGKCDSAVFFKTQLTKALYHYSQGDYDFSDAIARDALKFLLKKKTEASLIISYYSFLGKDTYNSLERLSLLRKANTLAYKKGLDYLKIKTLNNIGYLYYTEAIIDSSKFYFNKALKLSRHSFPEISSNLFSNLGALCLTPEKQLLYIDSAYQQAYNSNNLEVMQVVSLNKAFVLRNMNQHDKAYDELWLSMYLKDSLLNIQKLEAIAEMREKYESEKKEEEIKALNLEAELTHSKNKRNQYVLFGSTAFILLIAVGLWGRLYITRKSRTAIQKEKAKSDALLLNILPAKVAEELKNTGASEAQQFDQVSILFTDFKSFTQTAEKLTPKELVSEINTCFKAFDNICEKYGIEKIKTIGDSYMAASGLGRGSQFTDDGSQQTVSSEQTTVNLTFAALEMQEFMKAQKFEMRAGIHTGPVVAGIVGIKKFQYDIWGDAVNTASRMESHGEVGKVNISEATYNILRHSGHEPESAEFIFEPREELEIKGKGLMKTFFVNQSFGEV